MASKSKHRKITAINAEGNTQTFPESAWKAMPVDDNGLRFGWKQVANAPQSEKPVAPPPKGLKGGATGDVNQD
ncbi:MAG: hypothetical protein OHK0019_00270 [Saprospiraceae bacterium]